MSVGSGEGSLHLFVPIRVWGGERLALARLELRAWPRIELGIEVLFRGWIGRNACRAHDLWCGAQRYGSPVIRFRMPPVHGRWLW